MIEIIWITITCINIYIIWSYIPEKSVRERENDCYTDYIHKNLILRVAKIEFEFHAIKGIPESKILDRGNLNIHYIWILFEK